jgi:predicted NBD/HSP70 family sugar kinase
MQTKIAGPLSTLSFEPNALRVLNAVREYDALSRTDIARVCGISKASVTEIVSRQIHRGLLHEIGKKDSTRNGGKRQTLLRFNPRAGFIAGVEINLTRATIVITDLNATILDRAVVEYHKTSTPDQVFTLIFPVLRTLANRHVNEYSTLVGIGVGLPGLIDSVKGMVMFTYTFRGWQNVDVKSAFELEFSVPVHVENDVNAMTLAESTLGSGKDASDIVFIYVGHGVGAGIYIDGKLHRGVSYSAGEVGYNDVGCVIANHNEFPILYGNQKIIGELLSDQKIVDAVRRQLSQGRTSVLENSSALRVDDILNAANNHDSVSFAVLEEFATIISLVSINLINTLNPELLILSGKVMRPHSLVVELVKKQLRRDQLPAPVDVVKVRPGILGDDAVVLGAVGLVLHSLFESPSPKYKALVNNGSL